MHHVPVEHEVSEELSTLAPWVDMLAVSVWYIVYLSSQLSTVRFSPHISALGCRLCTSYSLRAAAVTVVAPSIQLKQRLALSASLTA